MAEALGAREELEAAVASSCTEEDVGLFAPIEALAYLSAATAGLSTEDATPAQPQQEQRLRAVDSMGRHPTAPRPSLFGAPPQRLVPRMRAASPPPYPYLGAPTFSPARAPPPYAMVVTGSIDSLLKNRIPRPRMPSTPRWR